MSSEPTHQAPDELAHLRATEADLVGLSKEQRVDQTCQGCLTPYRTLDAAVDCESIHERKQHEELMSSVVSAALDVIKPKQHHEFPNGGSCDQP